MQKKRQKINKNRHHKKQNFKTDYCLVTEKKVENHKKLKRKTWNTNRDTLYQKSDIKYTIS